MAPMRGTKPSPLWGVADDGSTVQIVVTGGATGSTRWWPPIGLRPSPEPPGSVDRRIDVHLEPGTGEAIVTVDGDLAPGGWDRVESELALFAAERLIGLVAVHAAVVVRDGGALLVPGASGAGKSTLCIAAAAVGARVLTDEYALVDPTTGLVSGWRRPVKLRRADGGVDRVDLAVPSEPVHVGLVAIVVYDPDAHRSWAPISGADAVLGLMANTVCARSRPDDALDAALAIGRVVPAVAGCRGEAAEAISELLAEADRQQPREPSSEPPLGRWRQR